MAKVITPSASIPFNASDTRWNGGRTPEPAAAAGVGSVKAGLASASANALALSKRSAGSFSSALAVAAATCRGTAFRRSVTGRTTSVTILRMIACADDPVWGGSPVSISYSTEPSE
jgi:hypothetical protein